MRLRLGIGLMYEQLIFCHLCLSSFLGTELGRQGRACHGIAVLIPFVQEIGNITFVY